MNFRLIHIFGLITIIAVYFVQRSQWLESGDKFWAATLPVGLATITGLTTGWASDSHGRILILCFIVATISATAITIEGHRSYGHYYDDILSIAPNVLSQATVCAVFGSMIGFIAKDKLAAHR